MSIAAAVLLIAFALQRIRMRRKALEQPLTWRTVPVAAYLACAVAIVLLLISPYELLDFEVAFLILLVLLLWAALCSRLRDTGMGYVVVGTLLGSIAFLAGVSAFSWWMNSTSGTAPDFRRGIAGCEQAIRDGRKDELDRRLDDLQLRSSGTFRQFVREFAQSTFQEEQ